MKSNSAKIERLKFFIKHFVEKYEPKCHFCGKPMDYKSFYPKLSTNKDKSNDDWVEHHVNLHHEDNMASNRVLAHKRCHRKYHKDIENGWIPYPKEYGDKIKKENENVC